MAPLENNVYTALRPIQILTKMFGFCRDTQLETQSTKLNVTMLVHVTFILSLKVFLIYCNLDPSKFNKVTNSAILNSGLWIQTEATLVISILYIVIALRKNGDLLELLRRFYSIDQEFSKIFFVKFHYVQVRHWISLLVASGIVAHFILILITSIYLWNLPFELWHKLSILLGIYVSNICIYAIASQFMYTELYLASRFQNINDILLQLIFDEPIDGCVLLNESGRAVDGAAAFVAPLPSHIPERFTLQNVFEKNVKSGATFIDTDDKDSGIRIHYPFDKEFPRAITNSLGTKSESGRSKKGSPILFSKNVYKTCITKLAFTKSTSTEDIINKLDKLTDLHDRLCDCVDMCNYLLALQVLLISLTICVYIVFGLFAKYRVWMDYQYEADSVAQMNIYWIVAYSIFVILGTYVSTRLVRTIKETAIVIHRIACRNENHILLSKLSRISQMLYSRKTTVGCGLIAFDWYTLFSGETTRANLVLPISTGIYFFLFASIYTYWGLFSCIGACFFYWCLLGAISFYWSYWKCMSIDDNRKK